MRVKNEGRWIERAIKSILPVCDRILVLDDHSTDDTAAIAKRLGCTVYDSPFKGIDETRDKDYLLNKAYGQAEIGDWCLMIDGDEEVFGPDIPRLRNLAENDQADGWQFKIIYLWDDEKHWRTDGVYSKFARPSFFKLAHKGLTFKATQAGGNFHCSSVPQWHIGRCKPSDIRLLHYGYMMREDRLRKYNFYRRVDGANRAEDGYRHIVVGDVFPPDAIFKHGGPLRVEELYR